MNANAGFVRKAFRNWIVDGFAGPAVKIPAHGNPKTEKCTPRVHP